MACTTVVIYMYIPGKCQQKRRPIGTVFEILIPIVVMGILILIPL